MGFVSELTCVVCGTRCEPPASAGTCATCGDPFSVLEIGFDMRRVAESMTPTALANRVHSHWRYWELLPIEPDERAAALPVGRTPITESRRLSNWAGVWRLRVKDEGVGPTASFKDRASSVAVLHALQGGAERIACASTGNAASSLAGCAARVGLPATIFVPERAPQPKLAQMLVYGADVRRVAGTYTQAYEMCTAACREHGWYDRNCAANPYLVEGKKTCGLEIAEQTALEPPQWVAVSVGDGCTIAGIGKGLQQMQQLGFLGTMPRLLGVQAVGMDPVATAFETGEPPTGLLGKTIADSIDVPVPRNWRKAVARVQQSDGAFVRVSDDEITAAMLACGRLAGVFAEPAAAAAVAGVRRAVAAGVIEKDSDVLAIVTGNGLKDVARALDITGATGSRNAM